MARLPVDKQAKTLMNLLKAAEIQLEAAIARAAASGALGTQANRERQLALVQQFLVQVQNNTVDKAAEVIVEAYRNGLVIADGEFKGGFNSIHQEAVNVLVKNLVSRINDSLTHIGRNVDDIFRREALRESALGLIESGTRREVTERLKQTLIEEGKTSFIDAAGRHWNLDRYVAMAVRTTSREATTQATLMRFAERGVDLVTISEHPTSCDICKPYQGKTFSLTGTRRYEKLDQFPPFHPNCRHVLLPAKQNAANFEKAVETAKTLDDLEAALGVSVGG